MYEVFEHTADVGLRIRADDLNQLFEDAARGLFSLLVTNLDQVAAVQERTFVIQGQQYDYLLFDWLSELLYRFDTDQLLWSQFDVQLDCDGLHATCRGEKMDPLRHQMDHEVKAITYHELKVVQQAGQWLAEVIVDI